MTPSVSRNKRSRSSQRFYDLGRTGREPSSAREETLPSLMPVGGVDDALEVVLEVPDRAS